MFYVRSIYVLCPWGNARVFSIEKTVVNSGFNVDDIFLVKKNQNSGFLCTSTNFLHYPIYAVKVKRTVLRCGQTYFIE